jgi:hypothetical protein
LQTSTDLAKETAEATTELQKQLQKVLKTVATLLPNTPKKTRKPKPLGLIH